MANTGKNKGGSWPLNCLERRPPSFPSRSIQPGRASIVRRASSGPIHGLWHPSASSPGRLSCFVQHYMCWDARDTPEDLYDTLHTLILRRIAALRT
jgi:hypothetical protein